MNIGKLNSLYDLLEAFSTEESASSIWNSNAGQTAFLFLLMPLRPKCITVAMECTAVKTRARTSTFRIGTMFEGSKLPLRKWFVAIYEITSRKEGISSIELSKRISKTAWFMNRRIRECFDTVMGERLDGGVELDETFVGGKNKKSAL